MRALKVFTMLVLLAGILACTGAKEEDNSQMIREQLRKFAKTELAYDHNLLDERQQIVVHKLYEAGTWLDKIFLKQVYSENENIRAKLAASDKAQDKIKLEYFDLMFGPFDRLEHDKPFIGSQPKPAGANFYPADMTKEEFENWIKEHPQDEAAFKSEFTMIRRDGDKLVAIPYTEFFKEELTQVIKLMREAADYADNPSLKKYLLSRAAAFESNDYYQSDMDWMDLKDHTIEVIIGPYEVYEDGLFGYKASFEMFLTLKDPQESAKLAVFGKYLNDMEKNLPIPDKFKNFSRGSESPIMVVQEVYSAGDTKAGVQTLAFNLPNDERVREAKGSKKVMLKNMHEAKFEMLLKPISIEVLVPEQQNLVTFDAFFNHTLMHEMSHGLGPGKIEIDGRKTEVKLELKDSYSKIEECKADVLGMYNNAFMIDQGYYPKTFANQMYATFLAGILRSVRFGINEAHGGGNAIIFNYLLEKGAYIYDATTNRVKVDFEKAPAAVKDLANKLLTIQAEGDYQGAKDLIAKYGVNSEPLAKLRAKLISLPVDINPQFEIAKH